MICAALTQTGSHKYLGEPSLCGATQWPRLPYVIPSLLTALPVSLLHISVSLFLFVFSPLPLVTFSISWFLFHHGLFHFLSSIMLLPFFFFLNMGFLYMNQSFNPSCYGYLPHLFMLSSPSLTESGDTRERCTLFAPEACIKEQI